MPTRKNSESINYSLIFSLDNKSMGILRRLGSHAQHAFQLQKILGMAAQPTSNCNVRKWSMLLKNHFQLCVSAKINVRYFAYCYVNSD